MRPAPTPLVRKGSGEPVLLVHAFSLSHHAWRDVVDQLAEKHDVLAVTLAGHWGGPTVPWRSASIARYTDELERTMDEHGWETAHIVGNSIGGWIAFELEKRGRARSVTAIAPAGGWRRISVGSILVGLRFLLMFPILAVGGLLGERAFAFKSVQRMLMKTVVDDLAAVSAEASADVLRASTHCASYLATLWAIARDGGITGLDAVRAPTLLALCARDVIVPPRRYGTMFLEQLPAHAERVTLPNVGHVPMLENPALVAETIDTFIARQTNGARNDVTEAEA
jgi:pimeloyl-ACP methyl ester carboxylesterase